MQRKVGAPPHRGIANRPLTKQGKANPKINHHTVTNPYQSETKKCPNQNSYQQYCYQ
jgi:hypothetical protein